MKHLEKENLERQKADQGLPEAGGGNRQQLLMMSTSNLL